MMFPLLLIHLMGNIILVLGNREKRYLVYPDGGPARAQFIIGLGIPVDLKEASVTVGTVIKFQYDLPTNSSEYTTRIYGFADTVSRDMEDNSIVKDFKETTNELAPSDARNANTSDESKDDEGDDENKENNTLVDIKFENRRKRSIYTEGGVINDIDTVQTKEIPLQEAIRRQELIDKKAKEVDEMEKPQRMNRWDFYKILENMVERYGFTGRPCVLRTICEAAEVPFTHENGLLGELGHILFTPSTTRDSLSHHTDNEYHAAERLGRDTSADCETLFPECEGSILDTFTHIGIDTLHKFGLY